MNVQKILSLSFCFFSIIIALFFLTSCNDDNGDEFLNTNRTVIESPCTDDFQKRFIYDHMKDIYLWYDKVPELDPDLYHSPEDFFNNLIYNEIDKWSYIDSKKAYENYYEQGKYFGYGFYFTKSIDNSFPILFVYNNSDAGNAGIGRGDIILSMNGHDILDLFNENIIDIQLGPDELGVSVDLKIEKTSGITEEITLTKKWVQIDPIIHYEILSNNNKLAGYLVYNNFHNNSLTGLDQIFEEFKLQNISELILDLRYNGGGSGLVAQYLASILVANKIINNVDIQNIFFRNIFNDKYSSQNFDVGFVFPENALDLDRIYIITTNVTCSASELLINGLKPYIDVIVIGNTTCGKPYGLQGFEFCDKVLVPVTIKTANANNETDYYNGILPTCFAFDNPFKKFGDISEDSLYECLFYMENNRCSYAKHKKTQPELKNINIFQFKGIMKEINAF